MGQTTVLMAARYSASDRGRSEADQAMLTFRPSPGDKPEHKTEIITENSLSLLTNLLRSSGAGEEVASVMPVDGDIENLSVGVELLLGPVTVVDVLCSITSQLED